MTTQTTGRPVQPSTLLQLAQFWALMDPRCSYEAHAVIAKQRGAACPYCHNDLRVYLEALPQVWP